MLYVTTLINWIINLSLMSLVIFPLHYYYNDNETWTNYVEYYISLLYVWTIL